MQTIVYRSTMLAKWLRHYIFSLLSLLWLPLPAFATPLQQNVIAFKSWIVTCLAVILIGGLVFFLARRKGHSPWHSGGEMRVRSVLSLGLKEKLVLVQVGDKQFLLGINTQQITLISDLTSDSASTSQASFAQQFDSKKAPESAPDL